MQVGKLLSRCTFKWDPIVFHGHDDIILGFLHEREECHGAKHPLPPDIEC